MKEECDIVRWSEGEFSKHAEYSLIPSLYTNLRYRIQWLSFPNTSYCGRGGILVHEQQHTTVL